MRLRGKVALITGSVQGIGRAIAIEMTKEGANVVLTDINKKRPRQSYEKNIMNIYKNNKGNYFELDMTNQNQIEETVDRKIDISVNNAGVIRFTQSAALEAAEYNILVNAVCPGPTDTCLRRTDVEMKDKFRGVIVEEAEREENEAIPLGGRPVLPEEIACLAVFLASDDNTFITGEAINISGGLEFH